MVSIMYPFCFEQASFGDTVFLLLDLNKPKQMSAVKQKQIKCTGLSRMMDGGPALVDSGLSLTAGKEMNV